MPLQSIEQASFKSRSHAFRGAKGYALREEVDAALEELQQFFPEVDTTYVPSKAAPFAGVLVLLIMVPFVSGIFIGVGGLIEYLFWAIHSRIDFGFLMGIGGLLVNIALVFAFCIGSTWIFTTAAIKLAVFNKWPPTVFATVAAFLAAAILFPFSPTFGIVYRSVSTYWFSVPAGIIATTVGTWLIAYFETKDQKLCFESGAALVRSREVTTPLGSAADMMDTLRRGDWEQFQVLPPPPDECQRALTILWWSPKARTAFIEMFVVFSSGVQNESDPDAPLGVEVTKRWLVFSRPVGAEQAAELHGYFKAFVG